MSRLFVTGMGRSGTTLLDRLLTNHPEMDVLSQPLPLVFVDAKSRFLKKLGLGKYFVLNDDLVSKDHTQNEFNDFLTKLDLDMAEIAQLFNKMESYSGQKTKRDFPLDTNSPPVHGFCEVIDKCLGYYRTETGSRYLGCKEIMCEEFLPYFCNNGFKCILIIRDPRDVLASANYPKGEKYIGDKKPTLFVLRSWRKSVEYANLLRNNKDVHLLRYEDLVDAPYRELDRITDFLGISRFKSNHFNGGILDRKGGLWQANSSFGIQSSFISKRSSGMFRQILSDEEIAYTEAICSLELDWLGYSFESQRNLLGTIKKFKDYGVAAHPGLSADFSSQANNIEIELNRIDEFREFYLKN